MRRMARAAMPSSCAVQDRQDSRSGTRNDTNLALLEDMSRHDTHLAPFSNDTRAVSTNHPTFALALQGVKHPDLIPLRNTLGDGDDQLDLILDSLNDGVGGTCRRDVNDRSVRLGLADGVADGAENGEAEVLGTRLFRVGTADHASAEIESLLGVERSLRPFSAQSRP